MSHRLKQSGLARAVVRRRRPESIGINDWLIADAVPKPMDIEDQWAC